MYFYDLIKGISENKKIDLFVDMDGVIASYDFGKPLNFKTKRPLKRNIETIKKVSEIPNVELYILSICKEDYQIEDKNKWLDVNAPFFKRENRFVLSKETIVNTSSPKMKANFLNNFKTDSQKILLDDDNAVLAEVRDSVNDIVLLQDSELID